MEKRIELERENLELDRILMMELEREYLELDRR